MNLIEATKPVGHLYIVETPCLPGWVKIGYSVNAYKRVKQLNTAVPVPFQFIACWESDDYKSAEKICHEAFGDVRTEFGSEHFKIDTSIQYGEFFDSEYSASFPEINDNRDNFIHYVNSLLRGNGINAQEITITDYQFNKI